MTEPDAPARSGSHAGRLALAALLLLALAVHVWLMFARWINPDEGAHLMDGVLALDGLVPGVDFAARQPFYVLAVATGLKVFGVGLVPGRILALVCTLGTAGVLYAIARDLFDTGVALLATALFLFLPFPLMLSVNAKTEPLIVLLATTAIWLTIAGLRQALRSTSYIAGVGVLSALGFYVRQSSLAILAAAVLILAVQLRRAPTRLLRATSALVVGFVAVCVVTGALRARHTSLQEAWRSETINPAAFVYGNVRDLAGALGGRLTDTPVQDPPASVERASVSTPTPPDQADEGPTVAQPLQVTVRNFVESVRLNVLVVAALLLSPFVVLLDRRRRGAAVLEEWQFAALVLASWAGVLGAAYGFWALRRGFFQAYFLELLPPLLILSAAVLVRSGRAFVDGTGPLRLAGGLAALAVPILVVPAALGGLPLSRSLYLLVPTAALALIHFLEPGRVRRWLLASGAVALLATASVALGPGLPRVLAAGLYGFAAAGTFGAVFWAAELLSLRKAETAVRFTCYALGVSALFLTLAEAIPTANVRYDGIWGPRTVRAVATEIRRISNPGDHVLSGGVIWEVQADRRPFRNLSHPLGLQLLSADEAAPQILRDFESDPPPVVVFDGYTERTYLAIAPELRSVVEARYTRVLTVDTDSRYPVAVYRRTD